MIKKMTKPIIPIVVSALLTTLPTAITLADNGPNTGDTMAVDNDFTELQTEQMYWEQHTGYSSNAYIPIQAMQRYLQVLHKSIKEGGTGSYGTPYSANYQPELEPAPDLSIQSNSQTKTTYDYPIASEASDVQQSNDNSQIDYSSLY